MHRSVTVSRSSWQSAWQTLDSIGESSAGIRIHSSELFSAIAEISCSAGAAARGTAVMRRFVVSEGLQLGPVPGASKLYSQNCVLRAGSVAILRSDHGLNMNSLAVSNWLRR